MILREPWLLRMLETTELFGIQDCKQSSWIHEAVDTGNVTAEQKVMGLYITNKSP